MHCQINFNPIALRKAKIVNSFSLSECNIVNIKSSGGLGLSYESCAYCYMG